jgi:hypothetical protein
MGQAHTGAANRFATLAVETAKVRVGESGRADVVDLCVRKSYAIYSATYLILLARVATFCYVFYEPKMSTSQ